RDTEGNDILARLKTELAPESNQLIALWGPGGTGKTTLAAQVARELRPQFPQRLAWVSALARADFTLATLLDDVAAQLGRTDLRRARHGRAHRAVRSQPACAAMGGQADRSRAPTADRARRTRTGQRRCRRARLHPLLQSAPSRRRRARGAARPLPLRPKRHAHGTRRSGRLR